MKVSYADGTLMGHAIDAVIAAHPRMRGNHWTDDLNELRRNIAESIAHVSLGVVSEAIRQWEEERNEGN